MMEITKGFSLNQILDAFITLRQKIDCNSKVFPKTLKGSETNVYNWRGHFIK